MARTPSSIIEIKEDEFAIIGESNSTFGGNKSMDSNQSLAPSWMLKFNSPVLKYGIEILKIIILKIAENYSK